MSTSFDPHSGVRLKRLYYHMPSFKNSRVFVEVIMYARELETQLRSLKMNNEVGFGTHIV